jgi:hypothetical protein
MMDIRFVIALLLSIAACSVQAEDSKATGASLAVLREANPDVVWDEKTAVVADVTCDGVADTIVIGREKQDSAWIGIIRGVKGSQTPKPITMKFAVGTHSQGSFCAIPVSISTGPIECNDEETGELPGCKRVKGCSDFSVTDEECDSFNFYWDNSQKKLTWWRR